MQADRKELIPCASYEHCMQLMAIDEHREYFCTAIVMSYIPSTETLCIDYHNHDRDLLTMDFRFRVENLLKEEIKKARI